VVTLNDVALPNHPTRPLLTLRNEIESTAALPGECINRKAGEVAQLEPKKHGIRMEIRSCELSAPWNHSGTSGVGSNKSRPRLSFSERRIPNTAGAQHNTAHCSCMSQSQTFQRQVNQVARQPGSPPLFYAQCNPCSCQCAKKRKPATGNHQARFPQPTELAVAVPNFQSVDLAQWGSE
jgi:hypothetical protein